VFTAARNWSLSWVRWINPHAPILSQMNQPTRSNPESDESTHMLQSWVTWINPHAPILSQMNQSTRSNPESDKSTHMLQSYFLRSILILLAHLHVRLPGVSVLHFFQLKLAHISVSMLATFLADISLLHGVWTGTGFYSDLFTANQRHFLRG
jgi:hypothetical protein